MIALAIVVVLVFPAAMLVGLLHLANIRERRRSEAISRQIMLTDAIHGELGPVVAPRVRRGRHGRWTAELAVPAGLPQIAVMLDIARASLGPNAEIVLTTQEPARQRRPSVPPALAVGRAFTR